MKSNKINIDKLLKEMTIDEKIGQLIQLTSNYFGDAEAAVTGPWANLGLSNEDLKAIGSCLNCHNAESAIKIQNEHLKGDRHKIPLIFMMDVIHGCRTIYPIPLALGASFDPEIVEECSKMSAKESAASGVHLTFTPMVDYVRDARWGRVLETCGEDAYLNGVMGEAQVKGFQGDDISDPERIATCVKHFAAYGGCEGGRDYNTVEISERSLRTYYLPAYKACLDAGSPMVMPSFNDLNGVPSIANQHLIQDILRKEWGFDGVIISDYNAVKELMNHRVAKDMREAARLAFSNTCDIEMMSMAYHQNLKSLIEEGVFTEEELDRSVRRILELKERLGLFDDPYHGASPEKEQTVCLTKEHRDIARRAAEGSAVLLKNDGTLPFSKDIKRIALIGPMADSKRIRGSWFCFGEEKDTVSVKEGIENLLPSAEIVAVKGCGNAFNDTDKSGFAEAIEAARSADAVILCLGEPENYSGEGNSRSVINLTGVQDELAQEIIAVNKNTAVLLFNGRPLEISKLSKTAPAILDMFFPGTEGGNAAANLLFGEVNPSGKVSMSFPKTVGQCPVYYNCYPTGRPKPQPDDERKAWLTGYIDCGNLALYPFGYGLSYTHFTYESLELDKSSMTDGGEINVSITVVNDGDRRGKEVVQLYLKDLVSSACRPNQELIAFKKIELGAGERKTVTFTVKEPQLRFWNASCENISEAGDFELSTGYADNLILTKTFTLVK